MTKNTLKIGLLGLGTVGRSVLAGLRDNADTIARRTNTHFEVIAASARTANLPEGFESILLIRDPMAVATHPDVDVVIELMGGLDAPRAAILAAIGAGKSVVTANKAVIAKYGAEILAAAQAANVRVLFEAAAAGGIPIMKVLRDGLAANQIQSIAGIINGTCNYILTEMTEKGSPFAQVLADAQAKGYAEADPSSDVGGGDAANKLCILVAQAFGVPLDLESIHCEGIDLVSAEDIQYAAELGYKIKSIGLARQTENGLELRVAPTLIPENHLLANISGVQNAVMVQSNFAGDQVFSGAGAGGNATASAVMADLCELAQSPTGAPSLGFQLNQLKSLDILPVAQTQSAYYVRLVVADQAGALAKITTILAGHNISIEAIQQQEPEETDLTVPVVLLTGVCREADMQAAQQAIADLPIVRGQVARLRVEHFD